MLLVLSGITGNFLNELAHYNPMTGFIELFSGAGGAALGFTKAGFDHLNSFEINKEAKITYSNNIKNAAADVVSVDEFEPSDIIDPNNTVIIGCPPCQGFSRFKWNKKDERNNLTVLFAKKIACSDVKVIFFENVANIEQYNEFTQLINILKRRGYKASWKILNAVDYGVPQRRIRLILIAVKKRKFDFNPATENELELAISCGLPVSSTVREAIGDLEEIEPGSSNAPPNHITTNHGKEVMERIKKISKNGGGQRDLPENLIYKCHKGDNRGYCDVFGRMRWEAPSPTITSGCTNVTKGRFIHPTKNRAITIREAAYLQTFPDDFVFNGTLYGMSTQVGNAVPPVLANIFANRIWDYMN